MKIWQLSYDTISQMSGMVTNIIIAIIQLYQKTISPDHGILRDAHRTLHCRFFPSCSDYAIQALRQYGLVYGIVLSARRIVFCNPFCAGGYDPVSSK